MAQKPGIPAGRVAELEARIERLETRLKEAGGRRARDVNKNVAAYFCHQPRVPERTFAPDVSELRARLIRMSDRKWVNGTRLRYSFFENSDYAGGNDQKALVREGFDVWRRVGIGIIFEEVPDITEAEIRIAFLRGDGAWSYVGRDVIDIPGQNDPTMNFGWDLTADPRGADTPVHEIGHTLGFPHEHQNPFSGIDWDEEAVYAYFGGPPNNWPRDRTWWNVLRSLPEGEVAGSEWDPNSIMHYAFPAGLIERPEEYRAGIEPAPGLSDIDVAQALFFYPSLEGVRYPELKPYRSESLAMNPGEQKNFCIRPDATRTYTMQTFGGLDTVMVLFEDQNGDLTYVSGDDDSGTDLNARLHVRLYKGREYVLRIRLFSNYATGEAAVMIW